MVCISSFGSWYSWACLNEAIVWGREGAGRGGNRSRRGPTPLPASCNFSQPSSTHSGGSTPLITWVMKLFLGRDLWFLGKSKRGAGESESERDSGEGGHDSNEWKESMTHRQTQKSLNYDVNGLKTQPFTQIIICASDYHYALQFWLCMAEWVWL